MKHTARYSVLLALALGAHAQVATEVRRAAISGAASSSGKCTIEVRVDISAEVDVYGDSARLRTLGGQPAAWTRLECSEPLPYNMTAFQFRGIDGRGTVTLVQDPRNNNSMAVIRIDDPRGGAAAYTFEIEWSGASGGSPSNGFASGWGTPPAAATSSPAIAPAPQAGAGGWGAARRARITFERALDLCRAEVHARGERDYGLRSIDITSVGVDAATGRPGRVTGSFIDQGAGPRRAASYRFACQLDYASSQVTSVEFLHPDGGVLQPATASSAGQASPGFSGYDQNRALRACQDAVVARGSRDGYQNFSFGATTIDASRADWITGTLTATRSPLTDTFSFACLMDMRAATVRNLEFNRQ